MGSVEKPVSTGNGYSPQIYKINTFINNTAINTHFQYTKLHIIYRQNTFIKDVE
jgi:hypothetical protein